MKVSIPSCPPLAVTTAWPSASSVSRSDFDQQRIVVHHQDAQSCRRERDRLRVILPRSFGERHREVETHRGALPGRAFDFDFRVVPLRDAVHHGQTQTGAALALGCEKRLQTAAPRLFVHADAGIGHFHVNLRDPAACRRTWPAFVRRVSVPPSGIASTALKTRLISASRISLSIPAMGGSCGASSVSS